MTRKITLRHVNALVDRIRMSASEIDSSSDTEDPADEDKGELEANKIVLELDDDC